MNTGGREQKGREGKIRKGKGKKTKGPGHISREWEGREVERKEEGLIGEREIRKRQRKRKSN